MKKSTSTIHVALLNEGTPCWRPVEAVAMGNGVFKIVGGVPEGEEWQFQPGDVVYCESHEFSDAIGLVALKVVEA